jgi:ADP-dependent NAD(P)H-hydrate dehydratase / NAD(P)H-hydrate epimerase
MKPLLTPEQAGELDRVTQAAGTPAEVLMERAGAGTARACLDLLGGGYGRRAVVVCGKGNNGGDGLVVARHLARAGVRTVVVLLEPGSALREPAAGNLARLERETDARIRSFDAAALASELDRADVAVDAIFGTGFRGAPDDDWAEAIDLLNTGPAPVVSVDIASGVDGATGAVAGVAVRADLTVTFGAAKLGSALLPGADLAGDVRVVDIGFDETAMPGSVGLTEPTDIVDVVPTRAVDGHKRASGTIVVVAGSRSMTGAVRLVSRSAARAGAGYVIVAVPRSILPVVQAELEEPVFLPLPETPAGAVSPDALGEVLDALEGAHALAIGPGLGRAAETAALIRELVREAPVPAVIDADALNAFAGDAGALNDRKAEAVLTPHHGELARLVGRSLDDAVTEARGLARATEAVALVKGTRTVIAAPHGDVRVNPTGSTALATAGTGDVLTGTIGGLLARGAEPFEAAWAGAYVHGLAGILAGADLGDGVVAGDVAERLPEAMARATS